MLYPVSFSTIRALSISIITPIAKFKPVHWCSKNPSPIFNCPLIATMRAFKTDWFFHILLLCYYVNDRAPLAYPAFRFRSVLVRSAFPQMSGLMLCIYPTFLSAGAASDRLGFYGVDEEEWSPTLLREPVSQTGASTNFATTTIYWRSENYSPSVGHNFQVLVYAFLQGQENPDPWLGRMVESSGVEPEYLVFQTSAPTVYANFPYNEVNIISLLWVEVVPLPCDSLYLLLAITR